MPFITVTSLNKRYRVGTQDIHVLRDLQLSVEAGEMLAIMGASGVGKSTLLHLLGGLDRPDSGTVVVDGSGSPPFRGDVAVGGGRIVAVGERLAVDAARTIDAAGLALMPGALRPTLETFSRRRQGSSSRVGRTIPIAVRAVFEDTAHA